MSKPTIVKFTKPWNGYGPGEIAGFGAEQAERLVAAGLAELNGKAKARSGTAASPKPEQITAPPPVNDAPDLDDEDDKKP